MQSPFDTKNKAASLLDRLALRILVFLLSVGYFFFLWRSPLSSLIAGSALFALVLLTAALLKRRTLHLRERMLRERVGGVIVLDELILMPFAHACSHVRDLLCKALDAQPLGSAAMRYGGETWLIRCAQCLQGAAASDGDVLAAHRARVESGCDRCALVSTGRFSPEAVRAAEWMDPPVRLIGGRQLALLCGRLHPASDEEIARHMQRKKKPFSWSRIRALALSPAKLRRHLLCAFLLTLLYLMTGAAAPLLSALLSFLLAILSAHESRRRLLL
ncbi:MAG: hypothetical protein IJD60_12485 [Clostridia bacterium]|nr:hypothetical protein [Clostridia bacterium]